MIFEQDPSTTFPAASFITGADLRVSTMLAVLSIWAAPRAIPRVSAMLALLKVRAATRAIPRVYAMLIIRLDNFW